MYTSQQMSDPMWNDRRFDMTIYPILMVPIQKDLMLSNQCVSFQWVDITNAVPMHWTNEDQANG